MSELVLHHSLISTCSQKVRYALGLKRLSYHSSLVDLSRLQHLSDGYLAINPNGVVPALVHDGRPITDSSVICEYLDEAFPARPISPAEPIERAAMRSWMRYFEEVATPSVRPISFNAVFVKGIARLSEKERQRLIARTPMRQHFYQQLGTSGFPPQTIREAEEKLQFCFRRVDDALSDERPFLLGDMLTIADVTLLPTVVRMADLGRTDLWKGCSRVMEWFGRMEVNEAFTEGYPPGSRVSADAERPG